MALPSSLSELTCPWSRDRRLGDGSASDDGSAEHPGASPGRLLTGPSHCNRWLTCRGARRWLLLVKAHPVRLARSSAGRRHRAAVASHRRIAPTREANRLLCCDAVSPTVRTAWRSIQEVDDATAAVVARVVSRSPSLRGARPIPKSPTHTNSSSNSSSMRRRRSQQRGASQLSVVNRTCTDSQLAAEHMRVLPCDSASRFEQPSLTSFSSGRTVRQLGRRGRRCRRRCSTRSVASTRHGPVLLMHRRR